ncbi:unnamed protein product [Kluyveromyces dobzhanskii CBS 2104]|uniref:WGS project CCBQ000000000 data, contig 00015 n=1 Tax=Kluyveromyces dobzhanskii CBS 2104 TaxID=1427455 RepID=A0A0A8LAG0_9SACH|nr:unnamed protein product [Kluyveromyces dobzhanskii CBS 2104]
MSEISVKEYVRRQEELEDEANEMMPYDPSHCTYSMGAIRQPIFACRTCNSIGVCYSCSIQCHSTCDLVELFDKRNFSCDCGTEKQCDNGSEFKPCNIRKNTTQDIADMGNRYGQNFKGLFCSCHTEYDPNTTVTMLQCVLGLECNEDWYHDHCILGIEKNPDTSTGDRKPPGFPDLSSFDGFISWVCIDKYSSIFEKLLSHERSDKIVAHKVYRKLPSNQNDLTSDCDIAKKRRLEEAEDSSGSYSLFLKEGYREEFKQLRDDLPEGDPIKSFLTHTAPFLTHDEKVYEPPKEEEQGSLLELGEHALAKSLSHQQTLASLVAFQQIKSKLTDFLRPFAENDTVVSESDIKNFFDTQKK